MREQEKGQDLTVFLELWLGPKAFLGKCRTSDV